MKSYRLLALLLCLIIIAVYWPAGRYEFLYYDDITYVPGNKHVKTGLTLENIVWAFRDTSRSNWHPLTWLSHMTDVSLFGLHPGRHHLVSVMLHAANAALLFSFLLMSTGGIAPSLLTAALFGLHPLHLESVAWIAERKDVLSASFWFLGITAYIRYTARPSRSRYLITAAAMALSLMCKQMPVTLPFTLLLLDFWPLGRWRLSGDQPGMPLFILGRRFLSLAVEKIPLFMLSLVFSVVAFWYQARDMTVGTMDEFPLPARLGNAIVSYGAYLGQMIWPADLSIFYPYPTGGQPAPKLMAASLVLAAFTAGALLLGKRLGFLITGWFWYLGTLVPVIGLVQIGTQARADRYVYVPLVGIYIMFAWVIRAVMAAKPSSARPMAAAAVIMVLIMAGTTRINLSYWRNSINLFSHAVAVDPSNAQAHFYLGQALIQTGSPVEGAASLAKAYKLNPTLRPMMYIMSARYLLEEGKPAEAAEFYRRALRLQPDHPEARARLRQLAPK